MAGLAMQVQQVLSQDPFDGCIFAFHGKRAGLIKVLWHDGIGLCLLTKRLERGYFIWPTTSTGEMCIRDSAHPAPTVPSQTPRPLTPALFEVPLS